MAIIDTTPSRENGLNTDLWVFVIKAEVIFHTARSNNHEVAIEILGEHNVTDIQNRYSAFETPASKTGNPQQYCWSHITQLQRNWKNSIELREDKGISSEDIR
jgi:hypothetical protein